MAADREVFYEQACSDGCLAVVFDIPLLLEQRQRHDVDYVVVVTASAETQRKRVLERPLMTVEKFDSILAKQLPDTEKRKLADYVINTDFPGALYKVGSPSRFIIFIKSSSICLKGFTQARSQVAEFIDMLVSEHPECFEAWRKRTCGRHSPINSDISPHSSDDDTDSYLMRMFDIIIFDLDDTLVPVMEPIRNANTAVKSFVERHMAKSAPLLDEQYSSRVKALPREQPMVAHCYTEIRSMAMTELCQCHEDEVMLVKEAIEVCEIRAITSHDPYLVLLYTC